MRRGEAGMLRLWRRAPPAQVLRLTTRLSVAGA